MRVRPLLPVLLLAGSYGGEAPAAEELVQRANALFERREHGSAETLLRQVLSARDDDVAAMVLLGRVRASLGGIAEAEQLYLAALRLDRSYEPAWRARAKLHAFQMRWKEAEEGFRHALALGSGSTTEDGGNEPAAAVTAAAAAAADARMGLARALLGVGDAVGAEAEYQRALEADPTNAAVHFDLGALAVKRRAPDEAAGHFARAATLDTRIDKAVVAQVYLTENYLAEAAAALGEVIASGAATVRNQMDRAKILELLRDADGAAAGYEAALAADPTSAEAHSLLGMLLLGCGLRNYGAQLACGPEVERATAHLKRAVELDPGQEEARKALAFCDTAAKDVAQWEKRAAALASDGGGGGNGGTDGGTASAGADGKKLLMLAKMKAKRDTAAIAAGEKKASAAAAAATADSAASASAAAAVGREEEPAWVAEIGGYRSVPRVAVATAEEFMAEYVNKSRPAVITNFQDGFAPAKQWTWDALAKRFGDYSVHASLSQSGRFDGPEDGALWGLPAGEEVLVRPPTTHLRFKDFATLMRAKGGEELSEVFYLEYLATHQYLGKAVESMIPMPQQAAGSGLELLLTNLWIGKGGTTAVLHYDDYENLLCQVRGRKELTLFPPSDIRHLYYVGRKKGRLVHEYPGNFRREGLVDSRAVVFASSVFLDRPDLMRHPALRRATPYRITIGPGDVLFLPAFWHHEVRSLPDENNGNVAVNYWFRNMTAFDGEMDALAEAAAAAAANRRGKPKKPILRDEL